MLLDHDVFQGLSSSKTGKKIQRFAAATFYLVIICFLFGWFVQKPSSQILGRVITKGKQKNAVALTFDDGPGVSTDTILSILKKYDARATFFVIGKNAQENPDLLNKIFDSGNEIGNHTYSHPLESAIESKKILRKQIEKTDEIINNITGQTVSLFRPPHGWRSPWMIHECNNGGKEVILWNIDSKDWQHRSSAQTVKQEVLKNVKPGSIILFHDRLNTGKDKFMNNTVSALPAILDSLTANGYRFLTVTELLEE